MQEDFRSPDYPYFYKHNNLLSLKFESFQFDDYKQNYSFHAADRINRLKQNYLSFYPGQVFLISLEPIIVHNVTNYNR